RRLPGAERLGGPMTPARFGAASAPARDLVTRAAVHVAPTASVREAAIAMSAQDTSLACVSAGEELVGVVTDRDLRTRVLARGLDLATPVEAVMTPDPCTVEAGTTGFEAMLCMVENDIRHLPVREDGRIIGIVSAADLFRDQHSHDAVRFSRRIAQAATIGELATIMGALPELQESLLAARLPPGLVGRVVTSV